MLKYIGVVVFCFSSFLGLGQNAEKSNEPIIIEELSGEDCFSNLIRLEGYLFKDDLDSLNTPEYLNYGLKTKKVEKVFPYVVKNGPDGKYVAYDQLVPMLIEAVEETSNLIDAERGKRLRLADEYANYKIYMENNLQQINYQLQALQSEMNGLNGIESEDSLNRK